MTTSAPEQDRHLRTDDLKVGLGGRTARGGVVTFLSQGLKFVLGMAATVVLARLLTPEDYGLVGMVAVVTGFVALFKDLGLSNATIQREEITSAQVSTLFWVNVVVSLVVMLMTAALAPLVAWFYGEPRLTPITLAYAAGFLFGGFTVQHEALLRRQMRFLALSSIEVVALVAGIMTAVVMARRGAGYWALVCNQLVMGLVYAVGVWLVCGWRPGAPVRGSGVRSLLAFGRNLTGFAVVNYFARTLDNLLIGKFWGSQQLGLYSKAYQLLLLPIDQINAPVAAVAVPALSRLADSPERYRQAYLRILEKLAILTMPGMALMIATSDWLVWLVLGPQWSGASRIFALLGIAGLVQPIANTTGWLFISQGRSRDMLQWGFIGSGILIAGIVAGLPWGAVGVATSYSLVFLLVATPLLLWFVGRSGPVRTADFYRATAPAACAAVAVLVVLAAFRRLVKMPNPLVGLVVSFGIATLMTLLLLIVLPRGRRALQDFKLSFALLTERSRAA